MNDYIDYMNALSATTSTNEQAQNAYQSMINYKDQLVEAKDQYKEQFAIIPELITGASGEYILKGLGSKAISLLSDTAKSAAKSAIKTGLQNAGIDEATAEATANDVIAGNVGNIANRIASGASDVARGVLGDAEATIGETANTLRSIGANVLDQVQQGGDIGTALSNATEQARSAVTGAVEDIANRGLTAGSEALETAQGVVRGVAQEGATAVSGLAEQGVGMAQGAVGEATSAIGNLVGQAQGAISTATGLAEQGVGVAQGAISGAQSVAGDIVSQGSSMATNFFSKTINNTSFPTVGQVQEQTGFPLEEWSNDWGLATKMEAQNYPSIYQTAPTQPQDVEMVDMASLPPSGSTATQEASAVATEAPTAEAGASVGAEAGAEVATDVGAEVATDVGATVATEAVGAVLDSTGVLAPIGAIVGLIGGLAGFFGLEHKSAPPPPPPPPPVLNVSQSFGT
jgi:uncharacterized protein YjbJ (UPF0337 family)